ncbi:hypothetical protein SCE1572_52075 [Sorangium cellulosum So0157-2]|uniref:Uncharacterized protein n=1 Tax=Sorangium cellulosum So0157-2 TaxID=1254432 RepID=S4YHE5_SORCE|nr:hypothetical protein SCE1572_52075 [Sorangium cellulosum So0157-2]
MPVIRSMCGIAMDGGSIGNMLTSFCSICGSLGLLRVFAYIAHGTSFPKSGSLIFV